MIPDHYKEHSRPSLILPTFWLKCLIGMGEPELWSTVKTAVCNFLQIPNAYEAITITIKRLTNLSILPVEFTKENIYARAHQLISGPENIETES